MTYPSRSPLREIGVARGREQASIVLRCGCCHPRYCGSGIASLLLLLLLVSLALLSVVNKERERQGEAHDDECIHEAVVIISRVVRRVSTGHGVVIDVVVQTVVVKVAIILNEIVDPFAQGPVLLCFCAVWVSTLSSRMQSSTASTYQVHLEWS